MIDYKNGNRGYNSYGKLCMVWLKIQTRFNWNIMVTRYAFIIIIYVNFVWVFTIRSFQNFSKLREISENLNFIYDIYVLIN